MQVIKSAPVLLVPLAIVSVIFGVLLAGWFYRERIETHEARIARLKDEITDYQHRLATPQTSPSMVKPDLKLSLLGGNAFVPDAPDMREHTGIAINARIRNAGAPSIAVDWGMVVVPQGHAPVRAQFTAIPEQLRLAGSISSAVIRSSEALGVKTARDPIPTGTAIDGVLLFYVPLAKSTVLAPSTRLEVSVRDIKGSESVATQLMGDWLQR